MNPILKDYTHPYFLVEKKDDHIDCFTFKHENERDLYYIQFSNIKTLYKADLTQKGLVSECCKDKDDDHSTCVSQMLSSLKLRTNYIKVTPVLRK